MVCSVQAASAYYTFSQDDKSLTIKLTEGGSRIVFLSASTTINKIVKVMSGDLKINESVLVNGTSNSDGTINANLIQIR